MKVGSSQGARRPRRAPRRTGGRASTSAALLAEAERSSLPIDVETIARTAGATLAFEPFDGDVSGFLVRNEGQTVIGVNSAHPQTRQRFTIAHESGHLKLHEGHLIVDKLVRVNMRRAASLPTDKEEVSANKFAAQLLMPSEQLRREFKRALPKRGPVSADVLVAQLAKTFAVSPQAMTYRLKELNLLSEMSLF
jgi:Zn-dependent peptidase ImmA (M78 family)